MAREDGFFDELARGLADGSLTRAKALRLMGAALLGGTLGSLGISGEAGADPPGCKRNGKNCKRNDQCCSGNCSTSGTCQAQTTTTTTTPTTTTSTTTSTTSTSTSTTTPTTTTSTTTPTTTTSTSTTTTSTTPGCLPDDSRCTTDTQCCGNNCYLGFCGPRNRIECGCQDGGGISTCASADCSDATAVNQVCTDQCLESLGQLFIPGNSTCIPEGCVS